jgi:hypothetical protein
MIQDKKRFIRFIFVDLVRILLYVGLSSSFIFEYLFPLPTLKVCGYIAFGLGCLLWVIRHWGPRPLGE